jgi:hypothetical protein
MSMTRAKILLGMTALLLISACQTNPDNNYSAFRNADPKSILIVPAVNKSLEVTAADYYLATIGIPIAERGFYTFPVHMVKRVLEDDGLSDADLVHNAETAQLAKLFGADAVLYVTIEKWESRYAIFATTTEIEIGYVLREGSTGEELWRHTETLAYTPNAGDNAGIAGLIFKAIAAAVERAEPNYIPLARSANALAVSRPHQGIPAGPYLDAYGKDKADF